MFYCNANFYEKNSFMLAIGVGVGSGDSLKQISRIFSFKSCPPFFLSPFTNPPLPTHTHAFLSIITSNNKFDYAHSPTYLNIFLGIYFLTTHYLRKSFHIQTQNWNAMYVSQAKISSCFSN